MPRPHRAGSGFPHPAFSAARLSTPSALGSAIRALRDIKGSFCAACASSSMKLSTTNTLWVAPTVFLATPHHLHRSAHVTRDLHCEERAVMLESPAEAAANEMVVDRYRVFRQAGVVGDTVLCPRRHLGADPDIAAVFRV